MKHTMTSAASTSEEQLVHGAARLELKGTDWAGATINLEVKTQAGSWEIVESFTEDDLGKSLVPNAPGIFRFDSPDPPIGLDVDVAIVV